MGRGYGGYNDKQSSYRDSGAENINRANGQIQTGDTVAIYLPNHRNDEDARKFVSAGVAEAQRKGYIKGPIEIWFSDKTKIEYS